MPIKNKVASSILTIQNPFIKLRLTIYNNEIFLVLPTSVSERKLVFLIDTGSQISILKAEKILDAKINTNKSIEIVGIASNNTIHSLGITKALLTCNDLIIAHEFHVMHENVFLRPDGIIGADFLLKYNATIDIPGAIINLKLPPLKPNDESNNSKIISSSLVRHSEINSDDTIYFEAVNNYLRNEKITVNQIRIKPKSENKTFYDQISVDYFRNKNFETVKLDKIELEVHEDLASIQNIQINKKFEIKLVNECDDPMTNPLQRQKYLMGKFDLSGLNDSQIQIISEICMVFGCILHTR